MRVGKGVSLHTVVFSPGKLIASPPNPHAASLPATGRCSAVAGAADGVMPAGSSQDCRLLFFPALWTSDRFAAGGAGGCTAAGVSVGMSRSPTASPAAGAHPDPLHPSKAPRSHQSHRLAGGGLLPPVLPQAVCRVGFIPPPSFLFPPLPPPSGSQLLITFACQPRLLICYRRAESGRSENKGDTITLCLLSSPIQISFID